MSDIPIADTDELSCSFYFPDPSAALTFFNNDVTERALQSDEGFVMDDSKAADMSTIPSSYMTSFQVQPLSPLIESDNTGEATASSQRSSGSNNGGYNGESKSEEPPSPSTPKNSKTSSSPNSPIVHSNNDDSDSDHNDSQETRPHLFINRYRHGGNMSNLKAEASIKRAKVAVELTPNLPSYHVYQLNGPAHALQLVKGREQYKQELRAFQWDTTSLFKPSNAPGSVQYKTELAEFRKLRRAYISNEPTAQQRRHSQQLLARLAEIKQSRKEATRKRRVV
ncbi:hypothetical protein ACHAPA_007410 [Fusarium lateritium]